MNQIIELYRQGLTIPQISQRLCMENNLVENVIIEYKLRKIASKDTLSIFRNTISQPKDERIQYLTSLSNDEKHLFIEELSTFFSKKNQNSEDVMISIWIVGELKIQKLSYVLCQFSSSRNRNIKRMVYSSMGKMIDFRFIPYLKTGCKDQGIQVRMYAIKSLALYDFEDKITFFEKLLCMESNERNREILKNIIYETTNQGKE